MIQKLVVQIPRGLQTATNATIFVKNVNSSRSEILIIKGGKSVYRGKKGMGISELAVKILGLSIKEGDEITLIVSGIDEQSTFVQLEEFLLNKEFSLPLCLMG